MKHTLNTALSMVAALAVIYLLPCCTSPLGKTLVSLSSIGLSMAAARGQLPPGTVVRIIKGGALLTTPGSLEEKLVPLAELGIEEAVERGELKPGDELIIREGIAEIHKALQPAATSQSQAVPVPEPEPLTGSK